MPKRSNAFQRLIHSIYTQVKPQGATVTESAMLRERDSGTEREVDVLLRMDVADSSITLAIECRDHARPADIKWIDELIGKYRDLSVDRVVAVSASGFTSSALSKAEANGIETKTLQEATDCDWPVELLSIGAARFQASLLPTTCLIEAEPPWTEDAPPKTIIANGVSESADQFMEQLMRRVHENIVPFMQSQLGNEFDQLSDLDRTHKLKAELEVEGVIFVSAADAPHFVRKLTIDIELTISYDILAARQRLLGQIGVTTVEDVTDSNVPITLMVVQTAGGPLGTPVVLRRDAVEDP